MALKVIEKRETAHYTQLMLANGSNEILGYLTVFDEAVRREINKDDWIALKPELRTSK